MIFFIIISLFYFYMGTWVAAWERKKSHISCTMSGIPHSKLNHIKTTHTHQNIEKGYHFETSIRHQNLENTQPHHGPRGLCTYMMKINSPCARWKRKLRRSLRNSKNNIGRPHAFLKQESLMRKELGWIFEGFLHRKMRERWKEIERKEGRPCFQRVSTWGKDGVLGKTVDGLFLEKKVFRFEEGE